jgi:hypothetical protein
MTTLACPNHKGSFDCTPFCTFCEGKQEYVTKECWWCEKQTRMIECDCLECLDELENNRGDKCAECNSII